MGQQLHACAQQSMRRTGTMAMMMQQGFRTQLKQPVTVKLRAQQTLARLTRLEKAVQVPLGYNQHVAAIIYRLVKELAGMLLGVQHFKAGSGGVTNTVSNFIGNARQRRTVDAICALLPT